MIDRQRVHASPLATPGKLPGLPAVAVTLVAVTLSVVALTIGLSLWHGVSVDWRGASAPMTALGFLGIAWSHTAAYPSRDGFLSEVLLAVLLILGVMMAASFFQYPAIAVGAPLADPWLARMDESLGLHVPTLSAWTGRHPWIAVLLNYAYISFAPQLLVVLWALVRLGSRERLWEFAFVFHAALLTTVLALLVVPAACAPVYYGFTAVLDMTQAYGQIAGLHEGTLRVIRFTQLDGLASFPSFHVGGAVLAVYAVRGCGLVFWALLVTNVLLSLATFMLGVHYAVDAIAGALLVPLWVWVWRRYVAH